MSGQYCDVHTLEGPLSNLYHGKKYEVLTSGVLGTSLVFG